MIEVHLRMSDQWPDLYGAGWVDALVRLYHERTWDFADDDRRDGYSVVLFGPHGPRYRHPPAALVDAGPASAGRFQRADHVPRGEGARASCHAAGRFSARRRECLEPAIGPRRPRHAADAFPRPRGVMIRRPHGWQSEACPVVLPEHHAGRAGTGSSGTDRVGLSCAFAAPPCRCYKAPIQGEGVSMKIVGFEATADCISAWSRAIR